MPINADFLKGLMDAVGAIFALLFTAGFGPQIMDAGRAGIATVEEMRARARVVLRHNVVAAIRDGWLSRAFGWHAFILVSALLVFTIGWGWTFWASWYFVAYLGVVLASLMLISHLRRTTVNIRAVPSGVDPQALGNNQYGQGRDPLGMVYVITGAYFAHGFAVGFILKHLMTYHPQDVGMLATYGWSVAALGVGFSWAPYAATALIASQLLDGGSGFAGLVLVLVKALIAAAFPGLTFENIDARIPALRGDPGFMAAVSRIGFAIYVGISNSFMLTYAIGLIVNDVRILAAASVAGFVISIFDLRATQRDMNEMKDPLLTRTRLAEIIEHKMDRNRRSERLNRAIFAMTVAIVVYKLVNVIYVALINQKSQGLYEELMQKLPAFGTGVWNLGLAAILLIGLGLHFAVRPALDRALAHHENVKHHSHTVIYGVLAVLALVWLTRVVVEPPHPAIAAAGQRLQNAVVGNTTANLDRTTAVVDRNTANVQQGMQPLPADVQTRLSRLNTLEANRRIRTADANQLRDELNAMHVSDPTALAAIDTRLAELEHPPVAQNSAPLFTPAPHQHHRSNGRPLADATPTGPCFYTQAMVESHPGSRLCQH